MNAPPLSSSANPAAGPPELGKLRWRCRRGMKELDILLTRYIEERFCSASNLERDAFKELLDTQDAVLYAYCLGAQPPPPRFAALIERITANSHRLP
jgi:antitoxin CptB